jgi:hypothetical protein
MGAPTALLVEGDSDRIALETLAARCALDLAGTGIEVIAMHGVTNVGAFFARFAGSRNLVVLCDDGEAAFVQRAARRIGVDVQIEVCVADLEDELIRALGTDAVERVIAAAGELKSFRALQQMPAHRDNEPARQLRRFIGTKSGRKAKYARLLVDALDLGQIPQPLRAALYAGVTQ